MSEKPLFEGSSPKLTFIFGLIAGLAATSVLAVLILISSANGKDGTAKVKPSADDTQAAGDSAPSLPVGPIGDDLYVSLAKDVGVKEDAFKNCYESQNFADRVDQDYSEGIKAGVTGTPGNIIIANGKGVSVSGAVPYEQFQPIIDALLNGNESPVPPSPDIVLPTISDTDHVLGKANAKVTIVEFSDFQCPFCSRHHPTMQRIISEYPDDVRWVYKHFPLESIHPRARPAAEASECVADLAGNDAFWQYADKLFANQSSL